MGRSVIVRITEWNRKRNGLKFDPILETRLLTEEAHEFMMAETTAERLREFADFLFVAAGSRAKFMAMQLQSADALVNVYTKWDVVVKWINSTIKAMQEILEEEEGITEYTIDEALEIVIEANEAKPLTKDDHGKVIKGQDYVDPIAKIKELIGED